MRNKNLPPRNKKYEEKTEETYKKGVRPYNQNLNQNQKMFDTDKYKYEYEQNRQEENQFMSDANYCPIHGLNEQGNLDGEGQMGRREENKYEYINEQVNNSQGVNGDESDNYKFYESKKVTKKVENINAVNMQNIISEQNYNSNALNARNLIGQENLMATGSGMGMRQQMEGMSQQMQRLSQQSQGIIQQGMNLQGQGMNLQGQRMALQGQGANLHGQGIALQGKGLSQQELIGMQGMGESSSQGCDYSKVYIATRAIPVYSELVNQQFRNINSSHICNVCGNPFEQGFINNTQEVVYSNNVCPLHGQTMIQQQFNGY